MNYGVDLITREKGEKCTTISIPSSLYEKLLTYSKKLSLSVRKCASILLEEGIKENLYAKKINSQN